MRKAELILSVVVVVAIGVALAGGFDRDSAGQPAAQPAATKSCCGEKAEAVAATDQESEAAGCCAAAKQASLTSSEGCGGCSNGLDAVLASGSGGCPFAKLASTETAGCSEEACESEGKCCSTDGKCCKEAEGKCCKEKAAEADEMQAETDAEDANPALN
jgi:hypothetical protein